jgi:hypothetical protein
MAESGDRRNVTDVRRPAGTDDAHTMGQIGALLAFEVDVKEGLVASRCNLLAGNGRKRVPTEVLDEAQVRGERELIDLPRITLDIAIVRDVPNLA